MTDETNVSSVSSSVSKETNVTYLKDYQPPAFFIDTTDLSFDLQADKTVVHSRLAIRKNPQSSSDILALDGEGLQLQSIAIDGKLLEEGSYQLNDSGLCLSALPKKFVLEIETVIDPAKNLTLEGLYLSDGMYCTQCEAEGFRRITYYLDRPDVMSVFTTKITADAAAYPVLLSNGNLLESGECDDGRHWALWSDPFRKPAYLFALVAGNLQSVDDSFTTMSGRNVALKIYVEAKDLDKCDHAMQSLKNSMKWDEEVYGREYDLDLFMIVAVDFFNMGAMENKGLNIFNTSCVLANPLTQSDMAFQRVEAVVAHEYFHNWSGNRVTCRDWFQLSLKEGFTVFRDASFSADMNSPTVKRVEDVSLLRSAQFAEDGGPMAHPIRPESYMEISNFYTLTIYEKGAEVIRMMHQLLGAEKFRAGSDLYFKRHDGQAVTCEDFVLAMEAASGVDLTQFRLWYSQSGTPVLDVAESWDAVTGDYTLTIDQSCPPTPGQNDKAPLIIPMQMALVSDAGLQAVPCESLENTVAASDSNDYMLSVTQAKQSWCFKGLASKPVPSLLRGFSAPVKLNFAYSLEDLLQLLANDNDGFVRWDATQRYAMQMIEAHVDGSQLIDSVLGAKAVVALGQALTVLIEQGFKDERWQPNYDAALLAEILRLPGYQYVLEQFESIDIRAIESAIDTLQQALASQLKTVLLTAYSNLAKQLAALGEYSPHADHIALRSLKNTCLAYLMRAQDSTLLSLAVDQYQSANNMTGQASALAALVNCPLADAESQAQNCLDQFYTQWSHESLVVNQWLRVQAASDKPNALQRVKHLMQHDAYDNTNPNKVRSLIGGFCMGNIAQFHADDGSGYDLLADEVIRLDSLNPQLASRLLTPLTQWRRFATPQSGLMRAALKRIADVDSLSADVFEVVSKSCAD
ncbi:aminopeptidase N [Pseudomonadales bacterium]|nr:aminopeptidase N [Pseudomonadales bacterium]